MDFHKMRINDIHDILIFEASTTHWSAKNRKNHIVGIKLDGSTFLAFKDNNFVISRNCIYFLNRKDDYNAEVYELGKTFSIHFTTYDEIDTDSFCIPLSVSDEFVAILEKAKTAHAINDNLTTLSLLYLFCAKLEHIRQKKYFPKDSRMTVAKAYIDLHYHEKNCLSSAIAESKLTSRRFGELFRKNFDITPNKYIVYRRIEQAKTLLVSQLFTAEQIAEMCGFSDMYYFNKVFKKLTGITPGKWTQQL